MVIKSLKHPEKLKEYQKYIGVLTGHEIPHCGAKFFCKICNAYYWKRYGVIKHIELKHSEILEDTAIDTLAYFKNRWHYHIYDTTKYLDLVCRNTADDLNITNDVIEIGKYKSILKHPLKPWNDPESLFCDTDFLTKITGKELTEDIECKGGV